MYTSYKNKERRRKKKLECAQQISLFEDKKKVKHIYTDTKSEQVEII